MKRILRCLVFASAISFALAIHLKPPKRKGKTKSKAKGNGGNKTANEPPVRETQAQKQERFRTETKMKKIEEIKKEFRDRFEIIQAAIRKSNAENVTKKLTQENLIKIQEKLIEQKLIDPKRDTIPLFDPRTLLFDVAYGDEPLEELSPVYAEYGLGPLGKVKYPSKSMTGILKAFPSFESVYPGISDVGKVCKLTEYFVENIAKTMRLSEDHTYFVRSINPQSQYEIGVIDGDGELSVISSIPKNYFLIFFTITDGIVQGDAIVRMWQRPKSSITLPSGPKLAADTTQGSQSENGSTAKDKGTGDVGGTLKGALLAEAARLTAEVKARSAGLPAEDQQSIDEALAEAAEAQIAFTSTPVHDETENVLKTFKKSYECFQDAIRESNSQIITERLTEHAEDLGFFPPCLWLLDVAYGGSEILNILRRKLNLDPLGKIDDLAIPITGILQAFPFFEECHPGISDVGKVCVLTPELIRLIRGQRDDFPPVDHSHKCFVRQVQQMPRAARKAGSDNDEYHYELGFFVRGKTTLVTISWVPKRLAYFCVIDQYFFDQEEDILAEDMWRRPLFQMEYLQFPSEPAVDASVHCPSNRSENTSTPEKEGTGGGGCNGAASEVDIAAEAGAGARSDALRLYEIKKVQGGTFELCEDHFKILIGRKAIFVEEEQRIHFLRFQI